MTDSDHHFDDRGVQKIREKVEERKRENLEI